MSIERDEEKAKEKRRLLNFFLYGGCLLFGLFGAPLVMLLFHSLS